MPCAANWLCTSSPRDRTRAHTQEELISAIYPNLETRLPDPKWLAERVIMAPKNESVHGLNNILIDRLPGELKVYKSIDTTVEANDACHFPSANCTYVKMDGGAARTL